MLAVDLNPAACTATAATAAANGMASRVDVVRSDMFGGVGRLKVADLQRYGDPGKLAAMRAIKMALDPYGIMNPGAVLALP